MASVCLYDLSVPSIGRGRWALPRCLLNDEKFLQEIEKLALPPLSTHPHDPDHNPQKHLQNLIYEIQILAKKLKKSKAGKMNSSIRNLTNCRTKIIQEVDQNNEEKLTCALEIASSITEKIQEIQRIHFDRNKTVAKANW